MSEKVSNLLDQMASYIEDPDGRVVLIAERDDNEHILNITTHALVQAAAIIRAAGKKILALEPSIDTESLDELAEVAADFDNDEELSKYSDSIDNVLSILGKKENLDDDLENTAKLASAFDNSGDDKLEKIASVLDEILLTIGSPKGAVQTIKLAEETEIEKLRAKYKKNPEDLFTVGNEAKQKLADEYNKEIENKIKVYKPLEAPLSSRCCSDHAGVSLIRIGDNVWQCSLDKKIFDFSAGYQLMDGSKIPGSSVQNQTDNLANHAPEHVSFSTREQKLNDNG